MTSPLISFLSDYGLGDDFVGVCHGVIAQGCPQARVIDLTHGIPAHDVRAGALILARALPYLPIGVHLAVVDPGVGGPRRAVAIATGDGRRLVGPDNGLLGPAARAAGGAVAAVDLAGSRLSRAPMSATFHGRDVFAPVAAGLAAGMALEEVGEPLDPGSLVALALPAPERRDGGLLAHVVYVDGFGNLQLDAAATELGALGVAPGAETAVRVGPGAGHRARYERTFADVEPGVPRALRGLRRGARRRGQPGQRRRPARRRRRRRGVDRAVVSALGTPRLHLRATDSTNTRARELAVAGAPHGTLVTAGEQLAGRGRQGRGWSAPAGSSLLMSLVVRDPPRLLALAAGVAVAALAQIVVGGEGPVDVKWPNDVRLNGRKLAGILVEGRPQEHWAVLGIGLNVAVRLEDLPLELRNRAATFGLEPDVVEPVLARLLAELSRRLSSSEPEILDAVRERDALRGHLVSWAGGSGRGAGIDDAGRLLVDTGGGIVALDAGEVHLG